jgi:CheY-specific phosphatase CheX
MTVQQKTLSDAISSVIEDLAMMTVEQIENIEEFQPQLVGWIDFTGPVQGRLSIRCREALAQNLAANLLGTDPDDMETQADAWDALAELLNVICGNIVSSIYDSERCFALSTPQINIIKPEDPDTKKDETKNDSTNREVRVTLLSLEDEPAEFTLAVES